MAFGRENVDVTYCDYSSVNQEVEEFYMGSGKFEYDKVFITDISVSDEVANIIEHYQDVNTSPLVILLDHHQTALELNKYKWANVNEVHENNSKSSGTSLLYEYLIKHKHLYENERYDVMSEFVELVRRYDTWDWFNKHDDIKAKQLNDLLYMLGRERFINQIIDIVSIESFFMFSDNHKLLLELRQEEIDRYIKNKSKKIIESEIQGYKAGVVFGEQFHSELGNKLSELNPHLDFIVIINIDSSISYRTNKNDINLGKDVAKIYGGGGHPQSSGSPISDEFRKELIEKLFLLKE